MKRLYIFPLITIILATLACGINIDLPRIQDKTIPVETLTINEAAPATDVVQSVNISMGAGELALTSGGAGLVTGSVRYNLEDWKPEITRTGDRLEISQDTIKSLSISTDLINEWDLQLNPAVVYDLEIHAGAYEGDIDLSNLRIANLEITDGASKSRVEFNTPNSEVLELLTYRTGASSVDLIGLGNANIKEMRFESGAGNYLLDFQGQLTQDANVHIKSGVSQITISVPEGMNVRIQSSGALNNVDTDGNWTTNGNRYELIGQGPLLSIEIDMGVGNLQLEEN